MSLEQDSPQMDIVNAVSKAVNGFVHADTPKWLVRTVGIDHDKFEEGLHNLTDLVREVFDPDADVYVSQEMNADGSVTVVTVRQLI